MKPLVKKPGKTFKNLVFFNLVKKPGFTLAIFFSEDLHLVANELSILAVGTEPARQDRRCKHLHTYTCAGDIEYIQI